MVLCFARYLLKNCSCFYKVFNKVLIIRPYKLLIFWGLCSLRSHRVLCCNFRQRRKISAAPPQAGRKKLRPVHGACARNRKMKSECPTKKSGTAARGSFFFPLLSHHPSFQNTQDDSASRGSFWIYGRLYTSSNRH